MTARRSHVLRLTWETIKPNFVALEVLMDRWNWIAARAFGPAIIALLIAVMSVVVLSFWQASPLLSGFVIAGRCVPLLALASSLWLVLIPTYRLWQWQHGEGLNCPRCGGPLGHERGGYANRGGAYRRCYACGDNINHRHYE